MEDRHTLLANFLPPGSSPGVPRTFFAVYDGHSSALGSEHASRRLHEYVAAQPAVRNAAGARQGGEGLAEGEGVAAALKAAFEDVDEEIIDVAVMRWVIWVVVHTNIEP
jgi:serine/threonine protein phosphatase PrpC